MEQKTEKQTVLDRIIEKFDIPPTSWTEKQIKLTDNNLLVAKYTRPTGEKVKVTPYKSYKGPGFDNTHKIKYKDKKGKWHTIAKGLDVNTIEKAYFAALTTMKHPNEKTKKPI